MESLRVLVVTRLRMRWVVRAGSAAQMQNRWRGGGGGTEGWGGGLDQRDGIRNILGGGGDFFSFLFFSALLCE